METERRELLAAMDLLNDVMNVENGTVSKLLRDILYVQRCFIGKPCRTEDLRFAGATVSRALTQCVQLYNELFNSDIIKYEDRARKFAIAIYDWNNACRKINGLLQEVLFLEQTPFIAKGK